ncbi:hypothetical protein [Actinoplanes rectilineatus]|uniref:hypothetical protein n=1 Tax=Actinoplanes rectilineatus TaxID=113571 RepID=UPI0012FCDBDF|nr:hypothetical protein [Actinoplanes rectilineatus]
MDLDAGRAVAEVRYLEQQLQALAAQSPSVQVKADVAAAVAKLAALTAQVDKLDGRDVDVDVDVDTGRAQQGVTSLAGTVAGLLGQAFSGVSGIAGTFFSTLGQSAVQAGGQISTAMVGAAASGAALTAATGGLNLAIGAVVTALLAGAAATVGLGVAFLALAPVVATVGGLLGAASGALFGLAAGALTLKLGLGGVGGAFSAMVAAQDEAAKSSASFAGAQNAVANASDQVKSALAAQANTRATLAEASRRAAQQIADAERAVGQARQEAARQAKAAQEQIVAAGQRVRDAQLALTDAERAALQVRRDLTEAQEDARRNLEDLASAVKNNGLDQRQAQLDVAEAQKALNKVLADPKATAEQKAQAQLTYERQVAQLNDLAVRGKRLAAEQQDAVKKGVEGSDEVTRARERIAQADKGVADARRGVAAAEAEVRKAQQAAEDARVAGAQKVEAAERALDEARRSRQNQQRQGAYQLAQASQAVTAAQRALGQASTQAGLAGGSALEKLNQQMAELSPNARDLVKTLFGLREPFGELRKFVQDRLLDGVSGQVQKLADTWIPHLKESLGGLADRLNIIGDGLFKKFGEAGFIKNVKGAVDGFGEMMSRIGAGLPGLFDGLARLGDSAKPVLQVIGDLIGGIFTKFGAWMKSADESGKLDSFMAGAAKTLDQIFRIGGLVFRIFGEIIAILFPQSKEASGSFLGGVEGVLTRVLGWLRDPENQNKIRLWVAMASEFIGKLVNVWLPAMGKLITDAEKWVTLIQGWILTAISWAKKIGGFFDAAGKAITGAWNQLVQQVFNPLKTFVTVTIPNGFQQLKEKASARWTEIRNSLSSAWTSIKTNVFTPMRTFVMETIPNAFATAKTKVTTAFGAIRTGLGDVWTAIKNNVFTPIQTFVTKTIPNAFTTGVGAIKTAWSKLTDVAKEPVRFVVNTVLNGGLIGGYNKIAKFFGVKEAAKISLPKGFAKGGVLPGYTPGRDVHRFYSPTGGTLDLSGGEPVMRPEFGRAVGTDWVNTMNQAARTGGVPAVRRAMSGQFKSGGIIGSGDGLGDLWKKIRGKASDVLTGAKGLLADPAGGIKTLVGNLTNLVPGKDLPWGKLVTAVPGKLLDAAVDKVTGFVAAPGSSGTSGPGNGSSPFGGSAGMMRALRAQFPGLRLISGFRPGARTLSGNPSYHGTDRAVDVPPDKSVAKYIYDHYRNITKELITPYQQYNLHNGRKHTYTGAVWNQHNFSGGNAHDHWAARLGAILPKFGKGQSQFPVMDTGGWLQPGWSPPIYNGTGRNETVTPAPTMEQVIDRLEKLISAIGDVAPGVAAAMLSGTRRTVQSARSTPVMARG